MGNALIFLLSIVLLPQTITAPRSIPVQNLCYISISNEIVQSIDSQWHIETIATKIKDTRKSLLLDIQSPRFIIASNEQVSFLSADHINRVVDQIVKKEISSLRKRADQERLSSDYEEEYAGY